MPLPPTICPRCRADLELTGEQVACGSCGAAFACRRGHWDMAPDLVYSDDESAPCHVEEAGERLRVERYYLPMLRELARASGKALSELRVLDDGCGFGGGVQRLREEGVDAVGVDVGWREQEWGSRDDPWAYMRADGRALPFADESFDAVVSFGVIEHVGIEGESGASEVVASDYQEHRARYVAEALRVLRRPGLAVFSQPNGTCPVDFWHYAGKVPARWHSPSQPFLPRWSELERWVGQADPSAVVESRSPYRLLAFERIGAWWYGRLFSGALRSLFAAMRRPRLRFLTRSPLNPFLSAVVRKR